MRLRPALSTALLCLALAGCGGAGSDASSGEPAANLAPAYEVTRKPDASAGLGYVDVEVDDADDLRAVFEAVRKRYDDEDRGYRVQISCATGGSSNVLANAGYANGAGGAAQTGIRAGKSEFKVQPGARCPGR